MEYLLVQSVTARELTCRLFLKGSVCGERAPNYVGITIYVVIMMRLAQGLVRVQKERIFQWCDCLVRVTLVTVLTRRKNKQRRKTTEEINYLLRILVTFASKRWNNFLTMGFFLQAQQVNVS